MCFVLLIDDDRIQHFLMNASLDKSGLVNRKSFYFDAAVALSDIQKNARSAEDLPDVIFLDINMPLMSGWQFLTAYQDIVFQIDKPIDIFMLSSSIDENDKVRSQEYPFIRGFISKPLSLEHIIQYLRKRSC